MDVKIIPWEKGVEVHTLSENKLLIIHKVSRNEDDDKMLPFRRLEYSIYDTLSGVKEIILPNLSKHQIAEIHFASEENRLIYFFHIEYPSYPLATVILLAMDIDNYVCFEVFRKEINLKKNDIRKMKLIILSDQYLLLQNKLSENSENILYETRLYDNKNKLSYEVYDERFTRSGVEQIIPIASNVCAVRFGLNQIKNNQLAPIGMEKCFKESICLISISQFVADCLLKIKIISAEIIDEVYIEKTFSDIKKLGKYLVFSRISRENGSQEIFFYQYITKETSMLLNQNNYSPEVIFPVVMSGRPMVVRKNKKYYDYYRIGDNEIVSRIPSDRKILYSDSDYIVVKKKKKRLLAPNIDNYIEIYQFSGMKKIYKEVMVPMKFLLMNNRNLIIMIEEKYE